MSIGVTPAALSNTCSGAITLHVGGLITIVDPNATGTGQCFYRVKVGP